jgi:hypothetical protein
MVGGIRFTRTRPPFQLVGPLTEMLYAALRLSDDESDHENGVNLRHSHITLPPTPSLTEG